MLWFMCAIYVDLCDIYVWICVIYVNSRIIIFVMQNRKNRPKFYLFQLCHLPRGKQVAKMESHERWQLCHLPIKVVGKESFATCQQRQLAKSPLPSANKVSRQRISFLKKIKRAFATCQKRQSAKKFCYKKNKKKPLPTVAWQSANGMRSVISQRRTFPLPTAILAGGKGFADCFPLGRWQIFLCR